MCFTLQLQIRIEHISLHSGSWKSKAFKEYNFDSMGIMPSSGTLHPLMKVRAEFRQIFLEMG